MGGIFIQMALDRIKKKSLSLTPSRAEISGKFLRVGNENFYVRGVTYGTFCPNQEGYNFPPSEIVEFDFASMASCGFNSVRTYTVPPRSLLDIAEKHKLKVLVGLPWEQHITFLDDAKIVAEIEDKIREGVTMCAGHPAVLAFSLGNEIPAQIVRWYGKSRIEAFLKRLYQIGKSVDPAALFTYVNYPTTEYLDLSFTDFDCFNVYLESREKLDAYLKRLHNLLGDRPLLTAEIGLDSLRNGTELQAETLDWQIEAVFSSGCAGAFIFAWTDEWWRGGCEIEDWDFGLTTRDRKRKPALGSVSRSFREVPLRKRQISPKISVVCCSYNGSSTIKDTLDGLIELDYPNYEVIVVNDGSTDGTTDIVEKYPFRLISTANWGLSNARNTGLSHADGEIVAYIDDDAYPDKNWLKYLAHAFSTSDHAGIGGPNIPPAGDGIIAESVANSPGGPIHVLLTDDIAEHIPGCNMAFRRDALIDIDGFDPRFRAAGDDVDICWRIQESGRTIGFHPAAVVWHHRRNSVKMYWRQQKGYGKAEALLEEKWPSKYNCLGHLSWGGRIYSKGLTQPLDSGNDLIFHGSWGSGLFQSVYKSVPLSYALIPLMPEWLLIVGGLVCLSLTGLVWNPLLAVVPLAIFSIGVYLLQVFISASKAVYPTPRSNIFERIFRFGVTALLHFLQPVARLWGRISHGLTPWRKRGIRKIMPGFLIPRNRTFLRWTENWGSSTDWLEQIEKRLQSFRIGVRRGGDFDRWDLETGTGLFVSVRGLLTIEEHGGGAQYLKFKCKPHLSRFGLIFVGVFGILSLLASLDNSYIISAVLGIIALSLVCRTLLDLAVTGYNFSRGFFEAEVATAMNLEDQAEYSSFDGFQSIPELAQAAAAGVVASAANKTIRKQDSRKRALKN